MIDTPDTRDTSLIVTRKLPAPDCPAAGVPQRDGVGNTHPRAQRIRGGSAVDQAITLRPRWIVALCPMVAAVDAALIVASMIHSLVALLGVSVIAI